MFFSLCEDNSSVLDISLALICASFVFVKLLPSLSTFYDFILPKLLCFIEGESRLSYCVKRAEFMKLVGSSTKIAFVGILASFPFILAM